LVNATPFTSIKSVFHELIKDIACVVDQQYSPVPF